MFNIFKKNEVKYISPMKGKLIPLEKVIDPAFSEKMMGDGYAIEPTDGKVVSPCDGVITLVYKTLHAIGIKNRKNDEVLLHIGIDTVKLDGEPFKCFVSEGQKVKVGDLLLEVDLKKIESEGYSTQSCVLFQNFDIELLKQDCNIDIGEENIFIVKNKRE